MLMHEGLKALSPLQVASLRIMSSGIIMSPLLWKAFKRIPQEKYLLVAVSGLLGNLLPAFLYCYAQTRVSSSMAGSLNALTPIFMLITGFLFFQQKTSGPKILGIFISFSGTLLLYASHHGFGWDSASGYNFLIVLATLSYGLNINFVNKYLKGVESVDIATMGLFFISVPSGMLLFSTGFSSMEITGEPLMKAIGFTILLGISGTALASVLYYMLIKRAGPVFSSMVTYGIPVVAILWGLLLGEQIFGMQVLGLIMVLAGVFMVTRWN
jgi:drug/metabolite transporter (DMT)-like permease